MLALLLVSAALADSMEPPQPGPVGVLQATPGLLLASLRLSWPFRHRRAAISPDHRPR